MANNRLDVSYGMVIDFWYGQTQRGQTSQVPSKLVRSCHSVQLPHFLPVPTRERTKCRASEPLLIDSFVSGATMSTNYLTFRAVVVRR